jgi:tRNA A-37 threonylcarbamoyl transferase component Bud32
MLLPVWALIVPTCLGFLTSMLMQNPTTQSFLVLMLLVGLASIPVMGVLLTAFFEDDRLNLSKDSLSFPLFMMPFLRFRRNRSWGELTSASLLHDENERQRKLLLHFANGENLQLSTKWFNQQDLEQVMLSIELWGTNCARSVPLIDYQTRLQNDIRGIGTGGSYTQMWEEELSRRFNATAFVPLEPDHTLHKGRLKIVRQIAFGGLSAIYLAQKDEQEMVVVKEAVVPASSDVQTRRKAEEMFVREAHLLVQLDHENIAQVYDHFVEDGRNYLLLEYVNGQDLRQHVKQNGAQPEALVIQWAMQVCQILKYLHGRTPPIIHRDLTPDNLVLRNDGGIKLIDFGAANQFVGTATGTLVGKQAYISPEQLRGKADLQSDIYSLGGTIYFLLTGKDPMPLAESRPKSVLPAISQEMDDLVAALTAFDKKARIAEADEAYQRLSAIRQRGESEPVLLGGTT